MIQPSEILALWKAHAAGLAMLARARCWTHADDLVQEAFVRLAKQPTCPDDAIAWLAKTVRNLAIDQARADRRRRQREHVFFEQRDAWFTEESAIESELSPRVVAELLSTLKEVEREIVVAHLWNGMTFRQIASMLGIPLSTVHRRYLAVLDALRARLETKSEFRP